MKHAESKIQAEIFQYLRLHFPIVFMVGNDAPGNSTPQRVARLKAMGLLPGVSDLVAVDNNGKILFIEIKTETGRLSKRQKEFQQKCLDLDLPYVIIRSIEDAINFVGFWK